MTKEHEARPVFVVYAKARANRRGGAQGSMFSGLMPAMVTPFDERGEVDLRAAEAVGERLIDTGVDGISALGSTGKFSYLSSD